MSKPSVPKAYKELPWARTMYADGKFRAPRDVKGAMLNRIGVLVRAVIRDYGASSTEDLNEEEKEEAQQVTRT